MTKAADRTVDMFSGKTQEEVTNEAERIKQGLDILEQPKEPVTIEQAADKWRAAAFQGQEWSTKLFGKKEAQEHQYRVSLVAGHVYLEKTGASKGSNGAFSYAGLMFPEGDLPSLARVLVAATKEYLKREAEKSGV